MDTQANQNAPTPPDRKESLFHVAAGGDFRRRLPGRGVFLAILLLLALWIGFRSVQKGFRQVHPGEAGIVVSKLSGGVRILGPGIHFLPAAFYDLITVRVSDRLFQGPAATFQVSTRDGLSVGLAVQARWAIDRDRLLARWASLPADPAVEVVAPVLASSFRAVAPAYDAAALVAEKRDELAAAAAKRAGERLAEAGLVLKDLIVADLKLPPEVERGRLALLESAQRTEQTEASLRFKKQEIEQGRLEAEGAKVRAEKAAESQASQRLIAAKAESDAMAYVLPLKEKEIKQRELEAEADKARRLKQAQAEAEASKIAAEAEGQKRRTLADAEAYAIRATTLAQFENLKREVELVQANPTWVQKTFAEKLSDRVQVIVMPNLSTDVLSAEVGKRIANGQPALAARGPDVARR